MYLLIYTHIWHLYHRLACLQSRSIIRTRGPWFLRTTLTIPALTALLFSRVRLFFFFSHPPSLKPTGHWILPLLGVLSDSCTSAVFKANFQAGLARHQDVTHGGSISEMTPHCTTSHAVCQCQLTCSEAHKHLRHHEHYTETTLGRHSPCCSPFLTVLDKKNISTAFLCIE